MQLKSIKDNFEGPSWSNRIFFYFCLFSFILIILMLILCFFGVLNIDLTPFDTSQYAAKELQDIGFYDNERYLLSALIQSLAATIALVITLSLVAVQLAAQSYSPRIIKIYKNNPDMWILLGIYIITIFYGLGLTKIVGLGIIGNYMEGAIFLAYFMGFFAFVCLVPYMLKTLDLLEPSNMVEALAEQIKIQKIKEDDPVLAIVDIINNALERSDEETVKNGFKSIADVAIYKCQKINPEIASENKLLQHLISHIKNIGIEAVIKNKVNSITLSIICLKRIGHEAANNELKDTVEDIIYWLAEIEKSTRGKEFRYEAIEEIINSLDDIATVCTDKKMDTAISNILRTIGTMKLQYEDDLDSIIIKKIVTVVRKIGENEANKKHEDKTKDAIKVLEKIGMNITKRHEIILDWDCRGTEVIKAIGTIGQKWIDINTDDVIAEIPYYTIEALGNVGTNIVRCESNYSTKYAIDNLKNIAIKALEKNIQIDRPNKAYYAIVQIGGQALEKRNKSSIHYSIEALEEIEKIREKY